MKDTSCNRDSNSTLISRNITVLGKRTSVRLEPEMWSALKEISKREGCKVHDICSLIQLRKNENTSLTAAIRVFLMLYYRAASTEDGHKRADHGNFYNMVERARMPEDMMKYLKVKHPGNKQLPIMSGNTQNSIVYNKTYSGAQCYHIQNANV